MIPIITLLAALASQTAIEQEEVVVLVIVHLDSISAYAAEYGEEDADALADRIIAAIRAHRGPILVMTQGWPAPPRRSPHGRILTALRQWEGYLDWWDAPDNEEGWEGVEMELPIHLYRRMNADRVILAGCWMEHVGQREMGCVNYTHTLLSRHLPVVVAEDLVGWVFPENREDALLGSQED